MYDVCITVTLLWLELFTVFMLRAPIPPVCTGSLSKPTALSKQRTKNNLKLFHLPIPSQVILILIWPKIFDCYT